MQAVGQSTESKRARLPSAMYSMNETAALFGLGYTTVWEMVQAGTFPVEPFKIGRQYKFPKRFVDRMLGLDQFAEPDSAA
jgi:excisionase family DNA binding protein